MSWSVAALPSGPAGSVRLGTRSVADPRGEVLVVPGRGDSLELRAEVADRVSQLGLGSVLVEHAGQGGSGRLGHHPDAVHVDDFEVHLRALSGAVETLSEGAGDRPRYLLAHSMGGLLAAHLLVRSPGTFDAAVLTAPMWGFASPPLPVAAALAGAMVAAGRGRHFAAGERAWSLESCLDMRTQDAGRRDALTRFAVEHRELVRGGSTWGWVRAATRSMRALDALPLEQVDSRVTVVLAREDVTVSARAIERHTRRFARGELVRLASGHDVLNAAPATRDALWALIDERFRSPRTQA